MDATSTTEWTDADDTGLIATKRIARSKVKMRCSLCQSDLDHASGPRGDGQTRTTRYTCSNDHCDGTARFTHVRTQTPRTTLTGDVEWRVDAAPWDLHRTVPTPLRCDFCGFEGSPSQAEYKYGDHGYDPAPGYETVFEKVRVPWHLTTDHDHMLQCPRCTRYNRHHAFKQEFTQDRTDPEDYVDEADLHRYIERTGERLQPLDRVQLGDADSDELYILLCKLFQPSHTDYDQPSGDYKIAKFDHLRSAAFGFPGIYNATNPERLVYRAVERSVPVTIVDEDDLEFVHRGPLVTNEYPSQYRSGRVR